MDLKQKQVAYHDWEASTYEAKFSISYDERCIAYAVERFRKVVPEGVHFARVLEVGAGTGFFLVNLALGGVLQGVRLEASDLSPGMLDVCARNGRAHGLDIRTTVGDAEDLPYADGTFDLVIGHAFLHHLPVPGRALQELHRVLAPGGTLVVAGEPTHYGERVSQVARRATWHAFRTLTRVPRLAGWRRDEHGAGTDADAALAALEHEVDLHTFRPADVEHLARIAGFARVRVVTEELTANWFGWSMRTIEASVRPGLLGERWAWFAYDNYRWLTALDERVLRHVVPRGLFYNLILAARKAPPTRVDATPVAVGSGATPVGVDSDATPVGVDSGATPRAVEVVAG